MQLLLHLYYTLSLRIILNNFILVTTLVAIEKSIKLINKNSVSSRVCICVDR